MHVSVCICMCVCMYVYATACVQKSEGNRWELVSSPTVVGPAQVCRFGCKCVYLLNISKAPLLILCPKCDSENMHLFGVSLLSVCITCSRGCHVHVL